MSTAAIILIGEELLSGKVQDTNAAYLVGRLRGLGVALRRIVTVPDDRATIGAEVARAAAAFDHVFTSGGVGPTHDDVTIEGVAAGFGVPVVRAAELEALIRAWFGDRLRPDHLRMADIPEGADLLAGGELRWPVTRFRNVWILPGIPEIFRAKFEAVADRFRGEPFFLRSVYLDCDEGDVAPLLASLEPRFGVSVGSYPLLRGADYRIRITVEARAAAPVDAACEALAAEAPAGAVVRADAEARVTGCS